MTRPTCGRHICQHVISKETDSYDSWIRGWLGSTTALKSWTAFSQKSAKYTEGECEKYWHHMKRVWWFDIRKSSLGPTGRSGSFQQSTHPIPDAKPSWRLSVAPITTWLDSCTVCTDELCAPNSKSNSFTNSRTINGRRQTQSGTRKLSKESTMR
jgi:hypothetical protein